ncbi:hypothetical protein BOTBODRAFT_106517 [Botryobasidium botryosum FD-172 SS1]|uniref:mRNA 3'-end-processing protein n=1 Tax=Botryobasidium botryosum (strain FD-172 SS1) TaxID=930990 RepID=A0A067MYA8_BOTB1|nr:hypothetical protein BOTBODRAFT_106517 [Botryobasidium botryosum FD-172 SS1]
MDQVSSIDDVIRPDFHHVNLNIESYIKSELGIKLDKDDQICKLALTPTGCPRGYNCPLRHTNPSPLNFQPPPPLPTHPRERERLATVCKHWLRGLCKKGDSCEFLHEYNLRRMPECWWFEKYGYCSAGDECLYAHPKERKVECPDYARGFCKLGPTCPRKHVRRVACQNYMSGFCPLGPECTKGHPKPNLPPESAYRPPSPPASRDFGPPPPGYGRYADFDRPFTNRPNNPGGGGGPAGDKEFVPRRNLDDVMCFKCGQKGHYANQCKNRNVPGFRGGMERTKGGTTSE